MMYDEKETVYSYKNWDLVQKQDSERLEELRKEIEEEWLEWEDLKEAVKEEAWGSEAIILEWEENWDYRDWKCEFEEAQKDYNTNK